MSFCRITGKARSLPKPNFFPIIPPISPADAQKLCRITSKRADEHKFVPLFEAGKRPVSLRCPVTGKNLGGKNNKIASEKSNSNNNNSNINGSSDGVSDNTSNNKSGLHCPQNDYKYVAPLLKRDSMEKGDLRAFEDLMKVLKEIKNEMTAEGEDTNKRFVYAMPSMQCGLVVPAEIEEAIRRGELESVSLSQSCDRAIFKVKGKRTLFVPLKEVDNNQISGDNVGNKDGLGNRDVLNNLYDGKGQSKETLNRQRQEIENRKKKNSANKKMFEDLEKKAENERQKDLERTQQGAKQKVPGGRRSKEAQQYRQKVEKFKAKFLSENNMKEYGDFKKALKTNLHVIDWEKIGRLQGDELKPLQMPGKRRKLQHEDVFQDPEVAKQLKAKKRIKNVYIPDHSGLEMVPVVEEFAIDPCNISKELLEFIHKSKSESTGYTSSLKSMFACQESLKILPNLNEFEVIGKTLNASGGQKLRMGCMYDRGDGAKFIQDISQVPAGANIIMGAVVMVSPSGGAGNNADDDGDGVPKFVPGEIVKMAGGKEVFVPGQRMNSANGEFVPGASIRSESGFFQFIPGVVTGGDGKKAAEKDTFGSGQFRAGQFVATGEGVESIKFVKGEVVHTTAGTKFVEGETVSTADGLKFVAG